MTLAFSNRYDLYQPTVLTDTYIVTFPLFDNDDLLVVVDGSPTTAYTVNATYADGVSLDAEVVLTTAVEDVDVQIYGSRQPRRENNYLPNSQNLSRNLQRDMDALSAVMQEQLRDFDSAIVVSSDDPLLPLVSDAAERALRTIIFSSDGFTVELGPTASQISAAQGYAEDAQEAATLTASYLNRITDTLSLFDFDPVDQALDNTTALTAMMAAMAGDGYAAGEIPVGNWIYSSLLTLDIDDFDSMVIRGAGRGVSRLVSNGDLDGFLIRPNMEHRTHAPMITVRDLSMVKNSTINTSNGLAFNVEAIRTTTNSSAGFILNDVEFVGFDSNRGWAQAALFDDMPGVTAENIQWQGRAGSYDSKLFTITGASSPTEMKFSKINALWAQDMVTIDGDVEGAYFTDVSLYANERALVWNTTAEQPLLSWKGGHATSSRTCFDLTNLIQGRISGVDAYQHTGGTYSGIWRGVHAQGCRVLTISENDFHSWDTQTDRRGIDIEGCDNVMVTFNHLIGFSAPTPMTTGIIVDGTSTDIKVFGNEPENVTTPESLPDIDSIKSGEAKRIAVPQYGGDLDDLMGTRTGTSEVFTTTGVASLPGGVNTVGNKVVTTVFDAATAYQFLYPINGARTVFMRRKNTSVLTPWDPLHVGVATGWTPDTGTSKRTANATPTATAASVTYTQAEITALMTQVKAQGETIKALKEDLTTLGILGA